MNEELKFIVETSAHHIHVTQDTLEALYGDSAVLGVRKMLSQPGQFASDKRLTVVYKATIKSKVTGEMEEKFFKIDNMSILGPVRKANQVEISMTDARALKANNVPVRESGDLDGSAPFILYNPDNGKYVECEQGLIVAKRHIHMTEEDAKKFNCKNGDIVSVLIKTGLGRDAILGDTVIRVRNDFALAMHIDTDECNAIGGASSNVFGSIIKSI